jgi:hypothetical protein
MPFPFSSSWPSLGVDWHCSRAKQLRHRANVENGRERARALHWTCAHLGRRDRGSEGFVGRSGGKIIFAIGLFCSVEHGIDERVIAESTVASQSQ